MDDRKNLSDHETLNATNQQHPRQNFGNLQKRSCFIERYLADDLQTALSATLRCCPVLATEPESRLAAIVDFTFNLGAGRLQTSTLRRRINQRDWAAAAMELRRWVYGGAKVLPGLVARRSAEEALLRKSQ